MSRYRIACVAALLVTLATYANHFHNDFHFDDSHTVQNNGFIRSLRNIPRFFIGPATFSSLPSNQSYRPVVTTTLAVDYRLGRGLNPLAFHVTSFSLFLVQCVLLLALYRRLMDHARPDADNRWLALLVAAWYALHSANAETVNYIIARSEILSTLGVVLALLLFAGGGIARRYHPLPDSGSARGPQQGAGRDGRAGAVHLRRVLRTRAVDARTARAARADRRPSRHLAVLRRLLRQRRHRMRLATTYTPGGTSRWQYLLTQPLVIVHYMLSLFLPVHLSADTYWPLVMDPLDGGVLIGGAWITVVLAIAWVTSRRRETQPIAFGLLRFFVTLLPTSSLVPLSEPMNDHRMYLPFVGLVLAVVSTAGLALREASARTRMVAAGVAVDVIAAMVYGTRQRNIVWRTEESLWHDATIKSPDNGRGLMNYGVIQMEKGNYPLADQYFARALLLTPHYSYLHVNLGVLKAALGRPAWAERHFREAQHDDPNNPVCYTPFARFLKGLLRTEEARLFAARAVELSPADADATRLLNDLAVSRSKIAK